MLFLPFSTTKASPAHPAPPPCTRRRLVDARPPAYSRAGDRRRRIEAVAAGIDGADHFIAVDHETPFGDLAILILESSDRDRFHICTLERGIGEGVPWTLPLDEHWRVVDFE